MAADAVTAPYLRPSLLSDALEHLARTPRVILAGGTDYFPARVGTPVLDDVLDISGIDALRGIAARDDGWWLGARTTWSDVIAADLPPLFDGLKQAARVVGGVQIQNAGTIGGNLCNASPAADGMPPLLTLDASVELESVRGVERVPVGDFVLGNRKTRLASDQIMTGIIVPKPVSTRSVGHFLKLGARDTLVISIVVIAGVLEVNEAGHVAVARLAIGACSPVARRLADLEARLVGKPADAALADLATDGDMNALDPIDDVRGSGAYRRDAALVLTRRLLTELGARV